MTISTTTQQFQNVFSFPFKDPDWFKKLAIGSLLIVAGFIIPISPILFVFRYVMRVMRRIIVEAGEPYLPEWEDWGQLFIDGLKLLGAGLIYAIPALILPYLGYMIAFLPAFLVPWLEVIVDTSSGGSALFPLLGTMLGFWVMGLGILLAVAVGILVPAALSHLVAKDRFSAAFEINAWWRLFRANFTGFLLAFVITMGFLMIGSLNFQIRYLTIILCFLIPLVFRSYSMYLSLIALTLFSHAYSDGVQKMDV